MIRKKLKICVLSRGKSLYSTNRLVESAKDNGHDVEVIDPLRCYMNISANKPIVHYQGRELNYFDVVIPRFGSSINFYGAAVLRQFEMMGVYALNESIAVTRARDKLRSLQILSRAGVEMPKTGFAHYPDNANDLVQLIGGGAIIIKLLSGTHGKGVILASTKTTAVSLIEAFRSQDVDILIQEFIKEAKGSDLRCFVVGSSVVAAMSRKAKSGEFRSNLHRGGTSKIAKLTKKEEKLAIAATKAIGLNVSGVDIVRSKRGPLVLEVNASPGLEGIEKTTKLDIADIIIRFIEANVKLGKSRVKGKG